MPKVKPVDNKNIKNGRRVNRRRSQKNKRIGTHQKTHDIIRLNDNVEIPPHRVWRTKVMKHYEYQTTPTLNWTQPQYPSCMPASSGLVPVKPIANSGQLVSKPPAVFESLSNATSTFTNASTQRPSDNVTSAVTPGAAKQYSKEDIQKYMKQKYNLFFRFDEGIKLDDESWFSVTPEKIAKEIAERCRFDYVLDAFCGAVVAIDIDPKKIELAQNNARVYEVQDRIVFVVADFFQIAKHLTSMDMVFLSPPWGGLEYGKEPIYDIEKLQPRPATELMKVARTISSKICLYLPRNSNEEQVNALALDNDTLEIRKMFGGVQGKGLKAISVYFNC